MEIKFLNKVDKTGDFVKLFYNVEGKKVRLEVGGTALSVYKIYSLSEEELGLIFVPVISDIYVILNEQGAELKKISIDSEGAKVEGKIMYSKEKINGVVMKKLKEQFNKDMWGLYSDTINETKYNPGYFRKMLDGLGGFETAKKLLSSNTTSKGSTKLWELGRLDLTVEALIIDNKEKYKELFSNEELETANRRLRELNYFK